MAAVCSEKLQTRKMASMPTKAWDNRYLSKESLENLQSTAGKTIKCQAAVAWKANTPLDITEIEVAPPKEGEIRVKVISNALCHTDLYTLDGHDPEGLFPCILGHEAAAIVESIGSGVTSVNVGDLVIPCYTPECREPSCIFCASPKTNLCPKIRATQGKGFMPDGTSRFSKDGKTLYHFMGCSTFSEYTVIAEISAAKIPPFADPDYVCMLGCGISTGWGAVSNTCKVEPSSSVVVFGLGAVGLAVIQAAKVAQASFIVGVDLNPDKFAVAKQLGAHECVNPKNCPDGIKAGLLAFQKWGYDYTFDCTGNVKVMRDALEVAHRGWGESCVIGVAAAGQEISTRPFQLVTGRNWKGTAFGGWKSRTEVPKLVQSVLRKEVDLGVFRTHLFDGLEKVNESIETLHGGNCLRAIIKIGNSDIQVAPPDVQLVGVTKVSGGKMYRVKHQSEANSCTMTFSIFLPNPPHRCSPPPPVLYYLSGLTCTDENARTKSAFQEYASLYNLAVVFPDTSARDVDVQSDSWDFGLGASFYVNATTPEWKKHNQMYTYIVDELPALINNLFPVDPEKKAITGHSMGGHGALTIHFKNPGQYQSASAFAPIANPTQCPWGEKAFKGYLGSVEAGKEYDATELVKTYDGPPVPILVDQGSLDGFLNNPNQLLPENLRSACEKVCRLILFF